MPSGRPHLLRDTLPRLAVAALLVLAQGACLAAGGGSGTQLHVAATVLPFTRLELHSAPQSLTVTPRDVDQGFVDVETPMALTVTSNRGGGAMILMQTVGDVVEQTTVSGLEQPVVVNRGGGVVALRAAAARERTSMSLRFRIFLSKTTVPGVHAWPIRISDQVL